LYRIQFKASIAILLFSLITSICYGQEFPKPSVKIPLKKSLDSISPKEQSLKTFDNDTIKTVAFDSIKKPKSVITGIITHNAEGYVKQDVQNNIVHLYDEAIVTYEDITLKAGIIIIDNNTNIVSAKGIKDSLGSYSQLPYFKQGADESTQDSISFNFKTEKARIYGITTEQQGVIILGEVMKKENDSTIYVKNIRFTTSQKKNPDYYIQTKKAKLVPNKKIVIGPSSLVIADVPTPLVLPFAYIPLTKGRTSGFLMPTWGESNSQGYFLQNGGYYFVLSDHFDLAVLGDVYTNGSWGVRTQTNYKIRYKYSGNFSFRFENLINGLRGLSDYSKSSNYNIRWSHSQDAKASPNSRFSASVNMGSSKYYKESLNEYNNDSFLNNTLSSSVSFYKKFVNTPFNISMSATHSQNTNTEKINMTLPSIQVNMDRIYPFVGKNGAKKNPIQKIGLGYNVKAENKIDTSDEFFMKSEMWDDAKSGVQHNASLSTNLKLMKYFTLSPSANYKEVWYFDKLEKHYDAENEEVVTDTISGFNAFREYSTGASLSTTLYGRVNFKKGRLNAIRHVIRPSISYTYKPDFSNYYEQVQQSADPDDLLEYSQYDNGIYGKPSKSLSNSLSFSLNNTLEAKVLKKDADGDSDEDFKKVKILNNLNFSTSYNMAADSLKWSPVRMSAGTQLFNNKMSVNMSANLDPYAINVNGQRINTFNINNNGSLFRLTNANFTANYSLSSKKDTKKDQGKAKSNQNNSDGIFGEDLGVSNNLGANNKQGKKENRVTELYRANFPWTLRLAYSLSYLNSNRQDDISSNSLMFSGDVELSPKWKVGFSSGYDFKNTGFTYTQLRFQRDLDSWKLNFNWVPFGTRQTYYFFIGVKSSVLSDLKYEKRQVPDTVLF